MSGKLRWLGLAFVEFTPAVIKKVNFILDNNFPI